MQPEPKGISPVRPFRIAQDKTQPSNHGLHQNESDDLGASYPHEGDGSDERPLSPRHDNDRHRAVSSSSSVTSGRRPYSPSSLSSSSAPRSGSPVDRIIEYEQATAKSFRKRKESPSFSILPLQGGHLGIPLTNFPNGW